MGEGINVVNGADEGIGRRLAAYSRILVNAGVDMISAFGSKSEARTCHHMLRKVP